MFGRVLDPYGVEFDDLHLYIRMRPLPTVFSTPRITSEKGHYVAGRPRAVRVHAEILLPESYMNVRPNKETARHQGLGNTLIHGVPESPVGAVQRRERLGGMLSSYYCEAV